MVEVNQERQNELADLKTHIGTEHSLVVNTMQSLTSKIEHITKMLESSFGRNSMLAKFTATPK